MARKEAFPQSPCTFCRESRRTTVSCIKYRSLHIFFYFQDSSGRTILLEYQGIKKVYCIESDDKSMDKVSLVERVFEPRLQTFSHSYAPVVVSLQRYDPEWEDFVDIDITQIRDRDKIKVLIVDSRRTPSTDDISAAHRDGQAHDHGVKLLISNLEDERSALDYKLSIA